MMAAGVWTVWSTGTLRLLEPSGTCTREPGFHCAYACVRVCVYTCIRTYTLEMDAVKANVPQARRDVTLQALPKPGSSCVSFHVLLRNHPSGYL